MASDEQLQMTPAQDLWRLLLERLTGDDMGMRMVDELWRRYNVLLRLRENYKNHRAGEEQVHHEQEQER